MRMTDRDSRRLAVHAYMPDSDLSPLIYATQARGRRLWPTIGPKQVVTTPAFKLQAFKIDRTQYLSDPKAM